MNVEYFATFVLLLYMCLYYFEFLKSLKSFLNFQRNFQFFRLQDFRFFKLQKLLNFILDIFVFLNKL